MPNGIRPGETGTSLDAVTSTGAGTAFIVVPTGTQELPARMTWTIEVTGTPTGVAVNLEGSIDGVTYYTIDSSTTTTSEMRHVVNKPVKFVRANLATLTGGTAPTVSSYIMTSGV